MKKRVNKISLVLLLVLLIVVTFVVMVLLLIRGEKKKTAEINASADAYTTEVVTTEYEEMVSDVEVNNTTEEATEESEMFTDNLSSYIGYIAVSPFVAKESDINAILAVAYDDYSDSKALYLWRTGFNQEDGYFINISSYDSITGEFVSYMKQYTGEEVLNMDISEILYYEEHENSITVYK